MKLKAERQIFPREFQLDAVRMSLEEGRTGVEVAENLGIRVKRLYKWRQQYATQAQSAFPGNKKRTAHDQEVWQLKK